MKVPQVVQSLASSLIDSEIGIVSVNLKKSLRQKLEESGFSNLQATELSEQWLDRLHEEIDKNLREWDRLGIPRPFVSSGTNTTLFTVHHPKYASLLGVNSLSSEYVKILNFIQALSTQEFLLVPICLLYLFGCNPIIVTDGAGDEGVDCMGKMTTGLMKSLCIFVQAKAGPSLKYLSKDIVRNEYAKFQDLITPKALFSQYLSALGSSDSIDGLSISYVIVSNSEFERPAREYALEKRVLLRSSKQIAFWLSQNFNVTFLEEIKLALSPSLKRDLRKNWYPLIDQYVKINS